jgi:hypothetical protein
VIFRAASPCDRHRPALVDFIDRGERGAATRDALDHLGRCRACEREMSDLALTIVALRRTAAEIRTVPVPAIAADRVVALRRRRDPWRWRFQLGSLVASSALAALVVAPHVGVLPASDTAFLVPDRPTVVVPWRAAEARIEASPDSAPVPAIGALPPRYPDGIRPRKEVPPTDAAHRVLDPR